MNIQFKQKMLKTKLLSELGTGDAFEHDNDIYISLFRLDSDPSYHLVFNLTRNNTDSFKDNELVYPVTINATVEYERAD